MMADVRGRLPASSLALAPLPMILLGLAYLSSVAIDEVLQIGPFDRAKLGWMIPVPLMLLAPGTGAIAIRASRGRPQLGWLSVAAAAVFAGAVATWRLTVTATQIGCEPVTHWTQALGPSLAVGVVALLAFAAASAVANLGRGTLSMLVIGAAAGIGGGALVLFAMTVAFPAVSCAPRPL